MRPHPALLALGLAAAIIGGWLVNPTPATPLPSPHVKVETAKGHGSATHIGNGYYVTAAHVVTDQPSVTIDGADTAILWANRTYDIALLRGPSQRAVVPLACIAPTTGQQGTAHGNPNALTDLTVGVRIAGAAGELGLWKVAVPIDGAVAPGMSGGAVVIGGELAAVTVGVSIADLGFVPSMYGVGFAVPGAVVCQLMGRGL